MAKTKTPTIVPLGERVLIQRVQAEETTTGGIVLPDRAKEKPKEGVVMSTGKGRRLEDGGFADLSVSKGDRVLFSSYAGTEVKVDGEEYLIMNEDEILAIVS